jgi:dolichol-phosphate mannosyltransferase
MTRTLAIIPTLNEAQNIDLLIASLLNLEDLYILVVDDRSSDGTFEIASSFRYTERVFTLSNDGKRGRRHSLYSGMKWAIAQNIIYWHYFIEMDGDFSHSPKQIANLLKQMTKAPIVIGSRYVPGGSFSSLSLYRRIISFFVNQAARILLGLEVKDITGGLRCYRRDVVSALLKQKISAGGFAGNIEALCYLVNDCQLSVKEVPIEFDSRKFGKSKFSFREVIDTCRFFGQIGWGRIARFYSMKTRS